MILNPFKNTRGFSLIEAVMVMVVIGISYFGFGFLFGNIEQQALTTDLTILATKLAKEKMEEVIQTKADSGYAGISSEASAPVTSGAWSFNRAVNVNYVNAADMSDAGSDTGYKKAAVVVTWGGGGAGRQVTLTTLLTNMVPSAVGGGSPTCP